MKFLIIQTAFAGDVVLATPLIEKLKKHFPECRIDFVLRKGNENLLLNHPLLNNIYIWDKKKSKFTGLLKIIAEVRKQKYEYVINLQRFVSSGMLTVLSGAGTKIGFSKNPLSLLFTYRYKHILDQGIHETDRNLSLLENICEISPEKPKLYPEKYAFENTQKYKTVRNYICLAPASVWFTKQMPVKTWVQLILLAKNEFEIYLLGGKEDFELCEKISMQAEISSNANLCGKLNFQESAALMKDASMNFVNDSAPMHIASAVNAPVCAIYCSTLPSFGFRPVSDISYIMEMQGPLYCRPCGIHGFKECPEKHFKCGRDIKAEHLYDVLKKSKVN